MAEGRTDERDKDQPHPFSRLAWVDYCECGRDYLDPIHVAEGSRRDG